MVGGNKMITKVELFQCDFDHVPSDADLLKCIDIAKGNGCIVQLQWTLKWSGNYFIQVTKDSTLQTLKDKLPKSYGI